IRCMSASARPMERPAPARSPPRRAGSSCSLPDPDAGHPHPTRKPRHGRAGLPTGKWESGTRSGISGYHPGPVLCPIAGTLPDRSFTMRRSLTISVLALALGVAFATTALAQGTGRSLDIQPGARQNGMGATGVAIADDATGVTWWNPAGLGFVNKSA